MKKYEYVSLEKKVRRICTLPDTTAENYKILKKTKAYQQFIQIYGIIARICSKKKISKDAVGNIMSYVINTNFVELNLDNLELNNHHNVRSYGYLRYINNLSFKNTKKLNTIKSEIIKCNNKLQQIKKQLISFAKKKFIELEYNYHEWLELYNNYLSNNEDCITMNENNIDKIRIYINIGKTHNYISTHEQIIHSINLNICKLKIKEIRLKIKKEKIIKKEVSKKKLINLKEHVVNKKKGGFKHTKIFKDNNTGSIQSHYNYGLFKKDIIILENNIVILTFNKNLLELNDNKYKIQNSLLYEIYLKKIKEINKVENAIIQKDKNKKQRKNEKIKAREQRKRLKKIKKLKLEQQYF